MVSRVASSLGFRAVLQSVDLMKSESKEGQTANFSNSLHRSSAVNKHNEEEKQGGTCANFLIMCAVPLQYMNLAKSESKEEQMARSLIPSAVPLL